MSYEVLRIGTRRRVLETVGPGDYYFKDRVIRVTDSAQLVRVEEFHFEYRAMRSGDVKWWTRGWDVPGPGDYPESGPGVQEPPTAIVLRAPAWRRALRRIFRLARGSGRG